MPKENPEDIFNKAVDKQLETDELLRNNNRLDMVGNIDDDKDS